jgi:hypothetical protein
MKLTTGILISILTAGTALGQQTSAPSLLDSIKAKLTGAQQPNTTAQNAALGNSQATNAQKTNGQTSNPQTTNAKPSPAQTKAASSATPAVKTQPAAQASSQSKSAAPVNAASSPVQAKASANAVPNIKVQPAVQAVPSVANKASVPAMSQAGKAASVPAVVAGAHVAPATTLKSTPAVTTAAQAGKAGAKSQAAATPKEIVAAKVAEKAKNTAENKPEEKPADKMQVAVEDSKTAANMKGEKKELNFTGHRDPFISPVVSRSATGSGCSTGKRCLAIDQIALKGVIKAESGMIAVVTNALDKAYFLRENDPVFNGYVMKITGDSVIFSETYEDKLGKPLTREVTKKLTTPAV